MKHIISLGAGVQSSTMALMAAHGEITPMPDAAIFADTQAEPESVYKWLDWLETKLPFPVLRVSKGNLAEASLLVKISSKGKSYTKYAIPAFIWDGKSQGLLMRQCTSDFKIEVIQRKIREIRKSQPVEQWIGISLDEVDRMKPATIKRKVKEEYCDLFGIARIRESTSVLPHPYITNRWPLIEARMNRTACLKWMEEHTYPKPPRSACTFCPYHSNEEWRRLRDEEPKAFQDAVVYERRLQETMKQVSGFRGVPWLHRSMIPLDQVDFSQPRDQGSFRNECEGMCGV